MSWSMIDARVSGRERIILSLALHASLAVVTCFLYGASLVLRPFFSAHLAYRRRRRYPAGLIRSHFSPHHHALSTASLDFKTVLITGVSTPAGIGLARAFYTAGHHVIGVDFTTRCGDAVLDVQYAKYSKAVCHYQTIRRPTCDQTAEFYADELLELVDQYRVDLWIPCAPASAAIDMAMSSNIEGTSSDSVMLRPSIADDTIAAAMLSKRTTCICLLPHGILSHAFRDTSAFSTLLNQLDLPALVSRQVTSRDAVHRLLQRERTKKFVLKQIKASPTPDPDTISVSKKRGIRKEQPLALPARTMSQTYQRVAEVKIGAEKPWLVQEVPVGEQYSAFTIFSEGVLKAFTPFKISNGNSMTSSHLDITTSNPTLTKAILSFISEFASRACQIGQFDERTGLTGSFLFTFLIQELQSQRGIEVQLLPISCDPRPSIPFLTAGLSATDLIKLSQLMLDLPKSSFTPTTRGGSGSLNGLAIYQDHHHQSFEVDNEMAVIITPPSSPTKAPNPSSSSPFLSAPVLASDFPRLYKPENLSLVPITSIPFLLWIYLLRPLLEIAVFRLGIREFVAQMMLPLALRLLRKEIVVTGIDGVIFEAWDLKPLVLGAAMETRRDWNELRGGGLEKKVI